MGSGPIAVFTRNYDVHLREALSMVAEDPAREVADRTFKLGFRSRSEYGDYVNTRGESRYGAISGCAHRMGAVALAIGAREPRGQLA